MKYIDTSALVKHYTDKLHEAGAEEITLLIESARKGEDNLLSNFLTIGEAISVFDKWARQKVISQDRVDALIGQFTSDIKELTDKAALVLEPLTSSALLFSIELILKHHISINDALHLYTALTNRDMIELFVCADDNLLRAAKAEGLEVLNPEER